MALKIKNETQTCASGCFDPMASLRFSYRMNSGGFVVKRPFCMDGLLAQHGSGRGDPAMILGNRRIVLARGVHVRVAKHVGDEIDIAGFTVEIGAERTAKLVRADFFLERCGDGSILLDHVFNGPLRDAPPLDREEEGVFMAGQGFDFAALDQIILECTGHLVREV